MFPRKSYRLKLRTRELLLGRRTLIMGVLNVTPDSFSEGGRHLTVGDAVAAALALERAGADILDIGAESTRPGSRGIAATEEIRRLLPVLEALRGRLKIPISVDTRKAAVAETALGVAAEMVNDVSGLRHEPELAEAVARCRAGLVLMHMHGTPETMQKMPFAKDVLRDVTSGLRKSIAVARRAGVLKSSIVVDPGFGFGKSFAQNYELLAKLPLLGKLGYPLLVGTSRKGFIGRTLAAEKDKSLPAAQRAWGTAATVAASILGGAHIVRVHDVAEMAQVARIADAIAQARQS
jgi:dihydropteroate synthase